MPKRKKHQLQDETVEEFLAWGGQVKKLAAWTQEHQEKHGTEHVSKFTGLGQMAEALQKAGLRPRA